VLVVLTLAGGLAVLAVHRRRAHQGPAAVPSAH